MLTVPERLAGSSLAALTAPALLASHARETPERVAFRSKHLGLYRERCWRDYASLVAHTARALMALGLEPGERVAIMGDAAEEWMICDLAAQSLGAIVYGIYPTASAAELAYQLRDGGAAIFIAEDQEYVDKVLPFADLPGLRTIVVIDRSTMAGYDHRKLRFYDQLLAETTAPDLAWFEEIVSRVRPADPAFIVYTSGTTGHPKGALVTHGAHLAAAHNLVAHYPALGEEDHRTVVYLPLCHVLGRDVAVTLPLMSRLVPHFGEDVDDLAPTLFEVAPTVLFTVPRYLQKFASQVLVGMMGSSPVKRASYELAMRLARRHAGRRWDGGVSAADRALYGAVWAAVFRPILSKLGLDRLKLMICGGAPLPADTMALWQMWGVNVVEMYGQTETAGAIIAGQRGPFPRPGDVGEAAAGIDLELAADGEIVVRGHAFARYWGNDEATAAVKPDAATVLTGDVGEWRDGRLRLIDRARDFIVTAGGKTLSPSFIEGLLRASPYVAEAVVIGHGRKFLTALVEIDDDTVAEWARSNDVSYTGFTSLARHAAVTGLIGAAVEKANGELSRVEQIKAFRILPKALDPEEEGEPVTPTRKVKRTLMQERFKALIDEMYDGGEDAMIAEAVGTTRP